MVDDLVYDVGMNNGDDTAHYLSRGFRVLAVEANPVLVAGARERFAAELRQGRLEILDVGIGPEAGMFEFWVNEDNHEHSSFVAATGARHGSRAHPIKVECVTFESVLAEHGVPYYLKIDIERGDIHCITAIDPADRPRYISTEAQSLEYLAMLAGLGYNAFKCVDQLAHNGSGRRFDNETVGGLVGQAAAHHWGRLDRRVISRLLPSRRGRFPLGSSGPFGEETPGPWLVFEEAAYEFLHYQLGYRRRGSLNPRSWFDFHATTLVPDPGPSPRSRMARDG